MPQLEDQVKRFSASLDLMRKTAETLAGRLHHQELTTIKLLELTAATGDVDR